MDFKKQIDDDIRIIKQQFSSIDKKVKKDEYAFNYWILNRIYSIDEEMIPNNIIDYSDKGIDCFVHYEDTKELFIIQNKYYSSDTIVKRDDVSNFLYAPIKILLNGNYTRSNELQRIFDRAVTDDEYKIWLHFYVTNDYCSDDIATLINSFCIEDRENKIKANISAKYFTLGDIRMMYYDERFTNKKSFTAILPTRRSGTSLDVRPDEYDLNWMIDLRYVLVNVVDLFNMYKQAIETNYELFEENIREYLGTKGINNGIIKTLYNKNDRQNFFYYNNGITIICKRCETLRSNDFDDKQNLYGFKLLNPQIVNGCQTVNSIAEVLSHFSIEELKTEFKRTFVLVKVFVFDEKTKETHENLDFNIVKYTNSQNGISEKAFAAKKNYFINIQKEFKNRGMLLLVKPSDKNKFNTEYTDIVKNQGLNFKNNGYYDFFEIENKNLNSLMIPLEKLLKVLLAFTHDGYIAFTKGSSVLNPNSQMYYKDFSLKIEEKITIDNMIRLFMVYNKAEFDKKQNKNDNRHPISYYLLSFMGYYFKNKDYTEINEKLDKLFSDKDTFNNVYEFFKNVTKIYSNLYCKLKNVDYNIMIKQEIDTTIFEQCIDNAKVFSYPDSVKWFLES